MTLLNYTIKELHKRVLSEQHPSTRIGINNLPTTVENLVQTDQCNKANKEAYSWSQEESSSVMKLAVAPKQAIIVAKILRNQGSFEEV